MKRLIALAATVIFLLGLSVPTVLAADPSPGSRSLLVSVNGTVDVAPGDHVDTLVVIDGDARIGGDIGAIVVVGGTATLTGATAGSLTVVNGSADLGAGTTILGDVRTLDGTVTQGPGASVQGSVRTLDGDLAALGLLLVPAFILLFIGLGLAAILVALLVAAFGSRQIRKMESLISREPGQVLVTGIVGSVVLPLLGILLTLTIVGAPIGLALLLIALPAMAFVAWIVAAIWIGDWIVTRMRGDAEADRPYLAAVIGVVVLAIAAVIPFVSAIATLFGFGALLLTAWRTFRHEASPAGSSGSPQPAVSAGQGAPAAP
jgi:hypothetical protein